MTCEHGSPLSEDEHTMVGEHLEHTAAPHQTQRV